MPAFLQLPACWQQKLSRGLRQSGKFHFFKHISHTDRLDREMLFASGSGLIKADRYSEGRHFKRSARQRTTKVNACHTKRTGTFNSTVEFDTWP